jgi:DNA processing protein
VNNERFAYLALTQVPAMGPARLKTLLATFTTALGAHSAPFQLLCTLPGFSRAIATAVKEASLEIGRKIVEQAAELGVAILIPDDPDYPAMLRPIPDPPTVLFALGNRELLSEPAVAIVGSRDHSRYGAEICRTVSGAVARCGIVVVSGMARGLDAVAHSAALDAGGATIGVLGNGPGVVYPAANRTLYDRVAADGLLLTEFPPGERPTVGSFPRRNRLISGLSRVTVIIEAAAGSGALITAGTALDQGREVMAAPGNITSAVSVGTNRLIRDGAAPLLEPADLLEHFPEVAASSTALREGTTVNPTPLPDSLSPEERELAGYLGTDPVHPDELASRCDRPIGEVLGLLSGLEIAGVVEQGAGRAFRRI